MPRVTVDQLADARAGDKGDTLMLAVLPRSAAAHRTLVAHLSAEAVAAHFAPLVTGPARRTVLPGLPALVFVLPGVLGGGVTDGSTLDGHGKTLSYHLLTLQLLVEEAPGVDHVAVANQALEIATTPGG